MNFQSFVANDLKTCTKKIENKSYHHRRILRPIVEDGNVNKVSFKMIFKRSEFLCLVLKPLNMNKNAYFMLFSMYFHLLFSICLQNHLNFCFDSGALAQFSHKATHYYYYYYSVKISIIDGAGDVYSLRRKELFWQYKLGLFSPKGLNERLADVELDLFACGGA